MKMILEVDIVQKSKKWDEKPKIKSFIEKKCQEIILLTEIANLSKKQEIVFELSISLVSDIQMRKINFEFRNQDKSTNVLSFPNLDENLIREIGLKKLLQGSNYLFLGDIIIAFETIKKESFEQKKDFNNHLSHMILHSLLHLFGYDHQDEEMAKIMENLEIKILNKMGIANPYIN